MAQQRLSVGVATGAVSPAAVAGGSSADKNGVAGESDKPVGGGSRPPATATEGGARQSTDIMTRTFSLSSAESLAEAESGLGAIAEEVDEDEGSEPSTDDSDREEALSSDGEAREGGIDVSEDETSEDSSSSSSGSGDDEDDEDDGQEGPARALPVDGADVGEDTSASPRGLTLDTSKCAKDDEAAEAFAAARFGATFGPATGEAEDRRPTAGLRAAARASLGGDRSSISNSLSPGPRAATKGRRASTAPGSRSLSPLPHGRAAGGATWTAFRGGVQVKAPAANCLSPMARLTPVEHGMSEEGNTVVLELGAWRVRAGVVEGSGGGGSGRSYFDDFACCLAKPAREGADLDEVVNGASSLAAPMYSKFRE